MEPVSESPVVAPSPDELASILRHVGDGITAQSPDGRLVYANDAAARLCGLESGEEMLAPPVPELLERFEIIGEDGLPLPYEELPNRRALADRLGRGVVLGYRLLPTRRRTLGGRPVDADPDAGRAVQLVVNVFHDITTERRAEERLHFLAEASTLLAASLDYEATLADLAKLLVPRVADYCIVDALDETGPCGRS